MPADPGASIRSASMPASSEPNDAPLRIYIGSDASEIVPTRVLAYSIKENASIPVEVVPMIDLPITPPKDHANRPRTKFSFYRIAIPELAGHKGRAVYLDSDMLVFGDVRELAEMPFDGAAVLCTDQPEAPAKWKDDPKFVPGRHLAVMILDCGRLQWDVASVIAGLDAGEYTYHQALSGLCFTDQDEVATTLPVEWNHLERYEPEVTRLLHFTVVSTQPWRQDCNPLGELWESWYRRAVAAGAVPVDEIARSIIDHGFRPVLGDAVRTAPDGSDAFADALVALGKARQDRDRTQRKLDRARRLLEAPSVRAARTLSRALRGTRRLSRRSRPVVERPLGDQQTVP
jgi:hypothetical protein